MLLTIYQIIWKKLVLNSISWISWIIVETKSNLPIAMQTEIWWFTINAYKNCELSIVKFDYFMKKRTKAAFYTCKNEQTYFEQLHVS